MTYFLYKPIFRRIETFAPPPPAVSLAPHLYFRLVHTLTGLLPPPLDDSPAALRTRNLAAIAKVASLLPVNANETDLAGTNSHDVAFEMWMSDQIGNQRPGSSDETGMRKGILEAMTEAPLAGRASWADGRESPGKTDQYRSLEVLTRFGPIIKGHPLFGTNRSR